MSPGAAYIHQWTGSPLIQVMTWCQAITWTKADLLSILPEAGHEASWGSEFVPLKKSEVGSFTLLHKVSRNACCFGICMLLKQCNCYESTTIWYTDHQCFAQYSEIINNLHEIPLMFCNYTVHSCQTWCKGPGQSPCNVFSISELEPYVTERSMRVCDPITD